MPARAARPMLSAVMTGIRRLLMTGLVGLAALCSGSGGASSPSAGGTLRILFAGDVMLGRGVARLPVPPLALLAGVRAQASSADLAAANLESPLTRRPHLASHGPNALEAAPSSARLLAAAGFDAMGVANNHAGDAGPGTLTDTAGALERYGIAPLGIETRIVRVHGLRVALLAFDATAEGPAAVRWSEPRAHRAIDDARARADIVAVGLHGGTEYVSTADPSQIRIGRLLASWDVDVVWGQGSHVVQPVRVIDPDGDGRPTVLATSLGNLLFDQHIPGTQTGALLEVVAGRDGVSALRLGRTSLESGPVAFRGWRLPAGEAVALGNAWWSLTRPVRPAPRHAPRALIGFRGNVVDAALGDANGDGTTDLAVAFRRPYRATNVSPLFPRRMLVDARGQTAHVGLYHPGSLKPLWVAGTLLRPVVALASCTGAIAVAYSTLDSPAVSGTGAWRWSGFGFVPLPDLRRPGVPSCADVDGDGRLDPVILRPDARRSSR